MNKIIAIGTALLIFFQSINIHFNDLMELDELMDHYQFHSEEYGDNFLVFVSKHYGKQKADHSQKHQEEQKDHEKLPFQHQTHCSHLLVFVLDAKSNVDARSEIPLATSGNFHYQISYSTIWADSPFQPPRHA